MNKEVSKRKMWELLLLLRKYLGPTALMTVFWMVLGWLKMAGIQWALLWPLNFLTAAQAGLEGNILGGAIGKTLLLILFNSMFQGMVTQKGGWKIHISTFVAELRSQGVQEVLKKIPQYTNLKLLFGKRTPMLLGSGILGIGIALLVYPFLTGNGSLINSMVCVALFLSIGKQVVKQRGLLISFLNLFLEKKQMHTLNRDAVNRIAAGFALGMALAVPVAAVRQVPDVGVPVWNFLVKILPIGMIVCGICGLFWDKLKKRRVQALLLFCVFQMTCGGKVLAAEEQYKQYELEAIQFSTPELDGRASRLYGPDVGVDGTVLIEKGKTYDFSWEGNFDTMSIDNVLDVEWNWNFRDGVSTPGVFPLNDEGLLGVNIKEAWADIHFKSLSLESSIVNGINDGDVIHFNGEVEMEVHVQCPGIVQLNDSMSNEEMEEQLMKTFMEYGEEDLAEVTYHLSYKGPHIWGRANEGVFWLEVHFDYEDFQENEQEGKEVIQYQGQTYERELFSAEEQFLKYNSGIYVQFTSQLKDAQYVPYVEKNEWVDIDTEPTDDEGDLSFAQDEMPVESDNVTPFVLAAGAGLFGLGGSAVLDFLSSPQSNNSWLKRKKDFDEEIEEDSNISMSIYKPFSALVNTKDAAVELKITISGGEGFVWRYFPTAICPDSWKAVIPAVIGTGEEAALVLTLSGAKLKKMHSSIFVTVIASARTPGGQRVRTSAAIEIPFHEKGLEAGRDEDGELKVTSYRDSNISGIAEIRVLDPEEYICEENKDGRILIHAKDAELGECTL